jgi:hypothetical protein
VTWTGYPSRRGELRIAYELREPCFPGLGHLLFWEDPDGFAATVAAFLLGWRPGS